MRIYQPIARVGSCPKHAACLRQGAVHHSKQSRWVQHPVHKTRWVRRADVLVPKALDPSALHTATAVFQAWSVLGAASVAPAVMGATSLHTAASEVWSAIGAVSIATVALCGLANLLWEANYDPEDLALREKARDAKSYIARQTSRYPSPAVAGKMTVDAPTAAALGKMTVDTPAAALAGKMTVDAPAAAAVAGKMMADAPAAAAVAGKMTVDAPAEAALAGKMTVDAAAAAAVAGKMTVDASAAAAVAGKMTVDAATAAEVAAPAKAAEEENKQAAAAYEAKLNQVLSESQLAYQQTRRAQQQVAPAPRGSTGLRQRVAVLSKGYQEKMDAMWATYERRKQEEQAALARSDKILLDLGALEEANKADMKLSPTYSLWQRILAFFMAIREWVVRIISQLVGGGSSTAGASA